MKIKNNIIRFLYESNRIEGADDFQALQQAAKAWKYIIRWNKLTTQNILKTHMILAKGELNSDELGAWRRKKVWIGNHEAKPYYAIPTLMSFWIKNANRLPKTEEEIKRDHINFEEIHPFIDFNGRIGRILLNWQRIKSNLPILVINEEEKYFYYKWFENEK